MRLNNYIKINKYLNIYINTENFENGSDTIKNVYSFTCSSTTCPSFCSSKSIIYEIKNDLENDKKNYKKYTLNLDWFQFIAKRSTNINFDNYHDEVIKIEKVQFHHKPNYRSCYLVFVQENEVCNLFIEHIFRCRSETVPLTGLSVP
jgi:hypothetical protein